MHGIRLREEAVRDGNHPREGGVQAAAPAVRHARILAGRGGDGQEGSGRRAARLRGELKKKKKKKLYVTHKIDLKLHLK